MGNDFGKDGDTIIVLLVGGDQKPFRLKLSLAPIDDPKGRHAA